jgi:hypothetical protein
MRYGSLTRTYTTVSSTFRMRYRMRRHRRSSAFGGALSPERPTGDDQPIRRRHRYDPSVPTFPANQPHNVSRTVSDDEAGS